MNNMKSTKEIKDRYIVRDKRSGQFKIKSTGFASTMWTENIDKAQIFRTIGAAKIGMYSYSINPRRRSIGEKIILPDWVQFIPVSINVGR